MSKPRRKKKSGSAVTPTFPVVRDALMPDLSVKGEAPAAIAFPGSFLAGFRCEELNSKAPALSMRGRKFYDEYMASAVWREKRARVLLRAGGCCERCATAGALEVHHRTYDRFGGEELLTDLEGLCGPCHCKADAERQAEVCAMIERRREEAAEEAHFENWARKRYGAEFFDGVDIDTIREAREEFDEWCNDRDGED